MQNRQIQGFHREDDARTPIAKNISLAFHNDADKLFTLSGLYRRLARWIEENTKQISGDISRLSEFMVTPEYEFSHRLFCARHFAIGVVKKDIDNLFPDENPLQTLYDKRESLIDELLSIYFAVNWPYVLKDKNNWQSFAERVPWNKDDEKDNIRIFFQIVAEIGIITDVLNKKAASYGLNIDYSRYDDPVRHQRILQLNDERLVRAIEACAKHLTSYSAWAVVYRVLCQYYDWNCNMAEFESKINELKFHKELKKCKDVGKTLNNNQWMNDPIDKWRKGQKKTFAQDFRKAIEEELVK